jgi:S1-C subfamily serine protease
MTIRLVCPSCREVCHVGADLRGKTYRCRYCDQPIRVPQDNPAPGKADDWALPAGAGARARRTDPEDHPPRRRPRREKSGGGGLAVVLLVGCGLPVLACLVLGAGLVVFLVRQAAGPDLLPQAEVPAGPVPAHIDPATVTRVKDATVYLRVQLPNGDVAEGSGFFCTEPGVVVTNAHVLGMLRADAVPPSRVDVVAHSGEAKEMRLVGSVAGVDRDNDLAVLRVPGAGLPPPLPVATATGLTETQKVYVFGFPLGAQLGRNITVSESSVSSLRRDEAGQLTQVQVNGGMHPGNSGGPVADARGAVVGVSVAGIRGTQIDFAIPGDFVRQLFDGQFDTTRLGTPYRADGRPTLPVTVTCLDPLRRARNLRVEVWAGSPGEERPGGWHAPPQPGDGPRQSYPLTFRDGAYVAEVPLAPLPPGKVCWVQPVLVNAAGVSLWDAAQPLAWEPQLVLERQPATLQFKTPPSPIERSLKLTRSVTASLFRGNDAPVTFTSKMEADVLESLGPDTLKRGAGIRLTIGKSAFVRESPGKKDVPPPQANAALSLFSPTFLVSFNNSTIERGGRDFRVLKQPYRDTVENMYENVCNTFETTTLPFPNRAVRPLESWPARVPMLVRVEGKRQIHDLHLTCTYEGVRTASGRPEALLALSGVVKGRGPGADDVLGLVKGQALVDVDGGFLSRVQVRVDSEVEIEEKGLRALVSQESVLSCSEGNSLGIKAATKNQPGAK